MPPKVRLRWFSLLILMATLLGLAGCQTAQRTTAEISKTPTATITETPTPTQTSTPAFTITPRPSNTPTITATPFNTLSPTPEPSPVAAQPAVLFPYQDINGKTVDWSYIHVTRIGYDQFDQVNDLWAFISFQLLDRAIHHRNLNFLGETITVYYLNVAHEFDGEMVQMQLVLGGTLGKDVAIEDIPAGGTAYLQGQVREAWQDFAPYVTHRDANRAFQYRDESYPLLFLKDLQTLLPTLPDEIILLADHPILFPRDDWPQIKLDMSRVSYLAARYQPFFAIDDYDRLDDQSAFAYALRDHILNSEALPAGLYAYSSQTLIIITGD
jgi:hypothetical protein